MIDRHICSPPRARLDGRHGGREAFAARRPAAEGRPHGILGLHGDAATAIKDGQLGFHGTNPSATCEAWEKDGASTSCLPGGCRCDRLLSVNLLDSREACDEVAKMVAGAI